MQCGCRQWAAARRAWLVGRQLHSSSNGGGGLRQDSIGGLSNIIYESSGLSAIQGYDRHGFTVNGIHMRGSVLVFGTYTLLWNVTRVVDISPRLAAPVHMLRPKIDIFFVGTGDTVQNVNPSLYGYFARKGITLEVSSSANAIAAFNLLNTEGRSVAAGLVSSSPVTRDDACLYSDEYVETDADRRLATALSRGEHDPLAPQQQLLTGGAGDASMGAGRGRGAREAPGSTGSTDAAYGQQAVHDSVAAYGYPGTLPPGAATPDDFLRRPPPDRALGNGSGSGGVARRQSDLHSEKKRNPPS